MSGKTNLLPFVHVVILNYKNWHESIQCLESVFLSDHPSFRVYLVDNDSGNDSLGEIMRWAVRQPNAKMGQPCLMTNAEFGALTAVDHLPSLVLIQNPLNNGFGAGNNVALRVLQNEKGFIWLLNPDVVVQPVTMSALLRFAAQRPENAIIGSVIRYQTDPGKTYIYGGGHINFSSATIKILKGPEDMAGLDYIAGGSLFTRAKQYRILGLLPENYFLYWEETDWCYGAKRQGYPLLVCDDAFCFDKIGTSVGRGFTAFYFYTRNGLYFVKKFKKNYVPFVLSFAAAKFLKAALSGKRERARGIYRGVRAFLKTNPREAE